MVVELLVNDAQCLIKSSVCLIHTEPLETYFLRYTTTKTAREDQQWGGLQLRESAHR